uniref:Uncharacterized protein n=1 Tax=Oreochromis aureus TaxID=47969 RepID=A0AAZ1XZZ3_OREAU
MSVCWSVHYFSPHENRKSLYKHQSIYPINDATTTMKHAADSIMVWPVWLTIINHTINFEFYQQILKKTIRTSVCDLNLRRNCILIQLL